MAFMIRKTLATFNSADEVAVSGVAIDGVAPGCDA
jgi:hypothetical protein